MALYDSPHAVPAAAGYREVAPRDVTLPQPGVRLIDVREPAEFAGALGHLPGAELVPLRLLPFKMSEWRRDEELLLVCHSGGRSARAAMELVGQGYTRVVNLQGGMVAWSAAGLPVER